MAITSIIIAFKVQVCRFLIPLTCYFAGAGLHGEEVLPRRVPARVQRHLQGEKDQP